MRSNISDLPSNFRNWEHETHLGVLFALGTAHADSPTSTPSDAHTLPRCLLRMVAVLSYLLKCTQDLFGRGLSAQGQEPPPRFNSRNSLELAPLDMETSALGGNQWQETH